MVFTSNDRLGDQDTPTGWYLPEAAHPYYEFKAAGFDIHFGSPKGGLPPVDPSSIEATKDDDECIQFNTDEAIQAQLAASIKLEDAVENSYDVIFVVGGFGVMWDLPEDAALQALYRKTYEAGGVAAAVCHGPAALVNVTLSDGSLLVAGKAVTGFSNAEEHAVERYDVVPFTCENKLAEQGGKYSAAEPWNSNVASDSRVVTGQNPQSARDTAKAIIEVAVVGVVVLDDEGVVVTASADRCLSVWLPESEAISSLSFALSVTHTFDSSLAALDWDWHRRQLLVALASGELVLVALDDEFAELIIVDVLQVHSAAPVALVYDGLNETVISVGKDKALRTFDREANVMRGLRLGKLGTPTSLAVDGEARRVFVGTSKKAIHIYSLADDKPQLLATLAGHSGPVAALAYDAGTFALFSAARSADVRVWDIGEAGREFVAKLVAHVSAPRATKIQALSLVSDGEPAVLISGGGDKNVITWAFRPDDRHAGLVPANLVPFAAIQTHTAAISTIVVARWLESGAELVFTGSHDGSVNIHLLERSL
ncbi:uncharacterized protein AMSG_12447 [Thecamonas trahens ATCC 50062]|uniref:DJ-1/PfpI domain-containing protein n=1 Tax=Thecamonas trahens ATCC 50062 TaxID=461836 RepID=A0A0L0DUZ4_THETB|nr:hypothetical protein AMSG_12447 [Thecamonas trahens ATCC 50062]KNC55901.1 hypothetical protein AMSG_12447 [Thecamonas trahens ATCC 50062]|eukprot:XP_013752743.1 hypothetical protein AMSG_12447 [Thecamonas trahens ATCC 50062]